MPVTSLHQPTQKWLTNFGASAVPGDELTWSVGHPLGLTGEFTTIRLGEVVAHDERGEPLFDEHDTYVKTSIWGEPDEWTHKADIRNAIERFSAGPYARTFTVGAHEYESSTFSGFRRAK